MPTSSSHSGIGSGYHNIYSHVGPGIEGNKPEGPQGKKYTNMVTVSVKNEGKGIERSTKGQLFEKFSSKSPQGIGLGLYLSKKIVEAPGGAIWFEEYDYLDENENAHNNSDNNSSSGGGSIVDSKGKVTVLKFGIPVSRMTETAGGRSQTNNIDESAA